MNDHPARPVRSLTDAHRLGKCGLDAIFKPGSKWHYLTADSPVLTVDAKGAYTSGVSYSERPEDAEAKDQPSWFIRFSSGTASPPHTLIPHDVVVAQRVCACKAATQPALREDKITADLRKALADEQAAFAAATRETSRLLKKLRDTEDSLAAARGKLVAAQRALTG